MIVKLPTAPEPWRQSGSDLARTIVVAGGADPGPSKISPHPMRAGVTAAGYNRT